MVEGKSMNDHITLSREQASQIFKAISGIGELLKRLPSNPDNAMVMYAITANLAVIQTNLVGMPRASSN